MQQALLDWSPRFEGPELTPADQARLTTQQQRLVGLMSDGQWRTLNQISERTGIPQASASAQLRHLRRRKFGAHTVDRKHLGNGLYSYRLVK
jgi:hypothetical protein